MGFEKDVSQIMTCINQQSSGKRHQSVLLSATLSTDVKRLANIALTSPVTIDIANSENSKQVSLPGQLP